MARFTWPWSRREQFTEWSAADKAFAAWWLGSSADEASETVTPATVLGLSAVLRSVQVISTTIASLPLRTFERQGDEKVRIPSVFDDPYPGIEGMTPFAWVETVLIHLLLWREAYLWHEERDASGFVTVYRPIIPDAFTVKRVNGKRVFEFTDSETNEKREVGSEQITYIPGPSLDGIRGHPLLTAARSIFSAAISGDKTAQTVLRRGIRLAGLITPAAPQPGEMPGSTDFDETEAKAILESLRASVVGRENAGDIALINRRLDLQKWTPNNIESQWHETRGDVLGEVGRIFGMPPHLLNDIEKQTSWGTGVAEQNLGLARYTLMGWSSRIEQVLSMRLPGARGADGEQFIEFDYKGLLQGTPADEIRLVIEQLDAGLISLEYATKVLNLPMPTLEQKAKLAPPAAPRPLPLPEPQEAAG